MTLASTPEERAQIRRQTLSELRPRRRACKHQWTPWRNEAILGSMERRDCNRCGRIQNRYPDDTG